MSTVMIVDDSLVVRKILTTSLQRAGVSSICFSESSEVLRWLKTEIDQVPNVVILDLRLPGMDGYTLARLLRSKPRFDGSLILFLTGYGSWLVRLRIRMIKNALYMQKPFKTQAILDIVSGSVPPPLHTKRTGRHELRQAEGSRP